MFFVVMFLEYTNNITLKFTIYANGLKGSFFVNRDEEKSEENCRNIVNGKVFGESYNMGARVY